MCDFLNIDFRSFVYVDYSILKRCDEYGCDGICRCGKIENAHVNYVDIAPMVERVYNSYCNLPPIAKKRDDRINDILNSEVSKEVDIYTFDRIFRINKVFSPDVWSIDISNGYYGEQIDGCFLHESIVENICNQINESMNILNLSERIEYLLKLEYGYILDDIHECQYRVDFINRKDIRFNNYYRKEVNKCKFYSDNVYKNIRAVVLKKEDYYQLVDGYHRFVSSDSDTIKVLIAKK